MALPLPQATSPEQLRRLLSTCSPGEAADLLGIARTTIYVWMRKAGIPVGRTGRRPIPAPPDLAELAAGRTLADIAQLCGVSRDTVRSWLQAAGLRSRGIAGPRSPEATRAAHEARYPGFAALYLGPQSLADIGLHFGVSRERVRQVAASLGLPPRAPDKQTQVAAKRARQARRRASLAQAGHKRPMGVAERRLAAIGPRLARHSDYDLAMRLGLSAAAVTRYRRKVKAKSPGQAHGYRPTPQGSKGKICYLLRRKRGLSWRAIRARTLSTHPCGAASAWARSTGAPWPPPFVGIQWAEGFEPPCGGENGEISPEVDDE